MSGAVFAGPLPHPYPERDGAVAGALVRRVADVPVPPRRPYQAKIVGRVEDGRIVPITPSAFAARSEGPIDNLFAAAEEAAAAEAPAGSAAVPVKTVAPVAFAPVSAPAPVSVAPEPQTVSLFAGHGGASDAAADFSRYGNRSGSLKQALDALRADDYKETIARRNGLSDPLDQKIVDYFLVRAGDNSVTSAMVIDFARRAPGWPSPELVRIRAEEALSRENPSPDTVIRAMGGKAESAVGARLLAKAYLAKGDRGRAKAVVDGVWHTTAMGTSLELAFASDFSSILTIDDHLTRIDKLVALHRFDEASALKVRLGSGPRAYLAARIAVATGASNAPTLLRQVPSDYRRRPGYRLAEVEWKRRQEDYEGAARLIEGVNRRGIVDSDAWWVETRIVARSLVEKGDARAAYKLVSKGFADGTTESADEAFHAGWIALRLKDGRAADRHFADLQKMATTPISLARAGYWRGRAAELRGDKGGARTQYRAAAAYGFTYYGQLSRAALGETSTGVGRPPMPTASDRAAIAKSEVAEAVRRLIAAGHGYRIYPLLDHLAETAPTAGQIVLVDELAAKADQPHLGLMVAKEGQRRGLPVGRLAYPTSAIPRTAKMPQGLDRALVYAIARQESLFNSGAVSPAGALGLMQVMPQTAAAMARELGISHSTGRLTSDPAHNATIGAAYLAKRLGQFDGSYILTFAAYNAGAGRVSEWIDRFGDPRDPRVDPVTWVEEIPYPETRNYVQRVMENVQVYREGLGTGHLAIGSDLQRGRAS